MNSVPVEIAGNHDIHAHRVLILDFGSQYTQLIARRVRECGVYSEIYPWDVDEAMITRFAPSGVILSGSPESVNLDDPPCLHWVCRYSAFATACRQW